MEQTQGVMEQVQMVHVDVLHPHEQNPRIDAAQVEDLTESIREHGIEVPLVAAPRDDSWTDFVVLGGHRRLTAAHAVGLTEVPVQIRGDLTDPKAQLAFMATENILRDQLTAVEEARLVQDMLDLGMTQAEVARQTALGKKRVSERVKLGKLAEDTGEKVHRGQITVDDALVIAEFGDDVESVERLERTAGTYEFDWEVSRAKQRRETARRDAEARKNAKKQGLRIIEEDTDFVTLAELVAEGWATSALEEAAADEISPDEWETLVIAEHKDCPGHSARINPYAHDHGFLEIGCDQVSERHTDEVAAEKPDAEPEPKHDPWDDITEEDLDAARIHREQHLAKTLPTLHPDDEARDLAVQSVVRIGWGKYWEDKAGIDFLQAITGTEGKAKVTKTLVTWPISVLIWLSHHGNDLNSFHRMMARGQRGSTYWEPSNTLRQLLERTGYHWSPVEQQAILLATGIPHDATPEADDAEALAEGGEAA